VDIDTFWTDKEYGYCFSKTQAVVLDLLLQADGTGMRRLQPGQHIVWLDNLFTSIQLFTVLRQVGIGAAGTVRTTTTKREIIEAAEMLEVEGSDEDTESSDPEDSSDEGDDDRNPIGLSGEPPQKPPFSQYLIYLKKEQ
jgi:hypothetical protein